MLSLPENLQADWIREQLPPLRVVELSSHQWEVSHPDQPQRVLMLKLPEDGSPPEGSVSWGQFKQTFRVVDGQGTAEELSMWEHEPNQWPVSWEKWVAQWLECLHTGRSQP